MTDVLLATFALLPDGEPGGETLVSALAERDIDARWVCWDDPDVDWAAADLVSVRATWDYHRRRDEFIAWARSVDKQTRLLNGAEVFAWNADKAYLIELGEHVAVVPTELLGDHDLVTGLQAAIDRYGAAVVKARIGAAGLGVVVAESTDDQRLSGLTAGPWIVQPLVESVRTEGETSVFVIGGEVVSQVHKLPAGDEIRVHEQYGGSSGPVDVQEEYADLARRATLAAETVTGNRLDYARVDMMRLGDGTLAVSELELIEPGLYLDVLPDNARPFADLVSRRLR
ncbi:ATP-grasp domain-containing protein [Nocardioides jensenii]|uniref:ATP-grasp domain-containing protein n=1 Tax=Nocardioides jensenii TaxID=1843 RepID=UPI00082E5284|nr:hypothetical protein [Nocardioides jensenii]